MHLDVWELFVVGVDEPAAAQEWARAFGDDVRAAWGACPRGGWLLCLASAAGVDAKLYARAGLVAAAAALELAPGARAVVASDLATVRAWTEGRAGDAEARGAGAHADFEASAIAGLQGDPPSPEGDERLRRSLAMRSLARAVEGPKVWPTAADLARAVAEGTPGISVEDFDRACATGIRAVIAAEQLPRSLARPPAPPAPTPCYVEVRVAARQQWDALARVWDLAAAMKSADSLDAEADVWAEHAQGQRLESVRGAIESLRDGDYEMGSAVLVDGSTGRLLFDPGGFPYGGVAGMCRLAEAFGCEVVAHDDGSGRVNSFSTPAC